MRHTLKVIVGLLLLSVVGLSSPVVAAQPGEPQFDCVVCSAGEIRVACSEFIDEYGVEIILGLQAFQNADDICQSIKLCKNPTCRLLPKYTEASSESVIRRTPRYSGRQLLEADNFAAYLKSGRKLNGISKIFDGFKTNLRETLVKLRQKMPGFKPTYSMPSDDGPTPWNWIIQLIEHMEMYHLPLIDFDGDHFGTDEQLRGTDWRGRDCNELDSQVHPGRAVNPYPGSGVDYNCNGIHGFTPEGKEWKDQLCEGSGQLGIVTIGDSGGAHFSIPPRYLTASMINDTTYHDLSDVIMDEFDFPQASGYTGFIPHRNVGPVGSIYKKMVGRNHCNHRDYQNLAVNGADSNTTQINMHSLNRTRNDHPVILFLELIGNDVCDPSHSYDVMTQPHVFKQNIINILTHFNETLPDGSNIWAFGLVDGSLLYSYLHDRTHPFGVTYSRFYDWLNCNNINPCWGWLNTNETVRNFTTNRASELNQKWREIAKEYKGKFRFELSYWDFPAKEILNNWIARGKDPADLIEPVDGFHPNQMFHYLLSEWIWGKLETYHPNWIGKINPNNQFITQLFGEQGGY